MNEARASIWGETVTAEATGNASGVGTGSCSAVDTDTGSSIVVDELEQIEDEDRVEGDEGCASRGERGVSVSLYGRL